MLLSHSIKTSSTHLLSAELWYAARKVGEALCDEKGHKDTSIFVTAATEVPDGLQVCFFSRKQREECSGGVGNFSNEPGLSVESSLQRISSNFFLETK